MNMRRIYLTGSDVWNPSKYDQPLTIPSISIIPSSTVNEPTRLPPHDDESDDTSMTEDCDSIEDTVDTDNIDNSPETIGQVSFKNNEVIRELEELWAYKKVARHQLEAVLKELREVSIRGDKEGRLIADAFKENYPQGGYRTSPPRQAPSRDDDGNIVRLPSGGNTAYTGSWTTFQIRNESSITEARSDEITHRLNVH